MRKSNIDYGRIEKLYDQGLTDTEIAVQMGCNVKTVRRWRHRNELPSTYRLRYNRLRMGFDALCAQGCTDQEIADRLRVYVSDVQGHRKRKEHAAKLREGKRIFVLNCQKCGEDFDAFSPRTMMCPRCKRQTEREKYAEAEKIGKKKAQLRRNAKNSEKRIARQEEKARQMHSSYGKVDPAKVTVKVPKRVQKQETLDPSVREKEYLTFLLRL